MKLESKIVIIVLLTFLVSILIYFLSKGTIAKNNDSQLVQKIVSIPAVDIPKNTSIIFILNESYKTGEKIEIKIKNIGTISYINQALQAPCAFQYFNPQGERFYPPEVIGCDLLNSEEIKPSEVVSEFRLSLKSCFRQEGWSCAKDQPLAPGVYTIRGFFPRKDKKSDALAEAQVTVVK